MTPRPPIEYANIASHTIEAYRSLAEHTGLPLEQVAELMQSGESRCLFGADGRLRSREELRNLNGGRDPKAALDELWRKRRPPGPLSGAQAQRELYRLRRKGYPR
jgi:hypothetical protein